MDGGSFRMRFESSSIVSDRVKGQTLFSADINGHRNSESMMSVLFIAGATSSVTDNYTVKYIVLVANAKRLAETSDVRFI